MVPASVSRKPCRLSLARNEGDDKRKCDTSQPIHSSSCLLVRRHDVDGGERRKRVVSYFHTSRPLPNKDSETENYTRPSGAETVKRSRGFWVPVCKRYKRMELPGVTDSYRRRSVPWEVLSV